MTKSLELQFLTENGSQTTISLEAPKEPVDPIIVKSAMEAIIASNAFYHPKGKFIGVKGARVIERKVTVHEM